MVSRHAAHRPRRGGRRQADGLARFASAVLVAGALAVCGCATTERSRATRAMDEGDYEGAARIFAHMTAERPRDVRLWFALARAEMAAERYGRARAAYEQLSLLRPTDPRPRVMIGHTFELERRWDQALTAYLQAKELAPDDPFPWKTLGTRLLRWGRAAESVAPLDRAVLLAPRDDESWNALALAHHATGDDDEALRVFARGLAANPTSRPLLIGLAAVQVNRHSFMAALATYDRLLALDERFAAAHVGRALVLDALGREDDAEQAFARAVEVAERLEQRAQYAERLARYRTLRAGRSAR